LTRAISQPPQEEAQYIASLGFCAIEATSAPHTKTVSAE